MKRIIINADDCGYSEKVNSKIEKFILSNKISSTTILANMNDLKGSVYLYEKYHDFISFGVHLNLTEGRPLLYSKVLLDKGFYVERDSEILFNGKAFRNKPLTSSMKKAIYKELDAQINRILCQGISISHFDSHHHIHTSTSIYPIVCQLMSKYNITKIRNLRNFFNKNTKQYWLRKGWTFYSDFFDLINHNRVIKTDYFTSFSEYLSNFRSFDEKDYTIELMCHPGGKYIDEEHSILNMSLDLFNGKLINYNEL